MIEDALAELIEDGEVQRHVRRVRREYAAGATRLCQRCAAISGIALSFAVPAGGIGIWLQVDQSIDVDVWAVRARDRGAIFVTARGLAVDGKPRPFARLGFAALERAELVEGVRRLAVSLSR